MKTNKGFTLIETVIYIGLFGLIISGVLASVFMILGNNARLQSKAMIEEEGSFMIGKVDWALSGIESVGVSNGNTLTVNKYNQAGGIDIIVVKIEGEEMSIKRNGGEYLGLDNTNVAVTCPQDGAGEDECFIHSVGYGLNPESISADIIVETKTSTGQSYAEHFSTMKFLRK